MNRGIAALACILLLSVLLAGCQPGGDDSKTSSSLASASGAVGGPVFTTAKFDQFKKTLGADFSLSDGQDITRFTKEVDPVRVMVRVSHNGSGGIHYVMTRVSGASASNAKIAEVGAQMVATVAAAVGLPLDDAFKDHLGISMVLNDAGLQYAFPCGDSRVTLKATAKPAPESTPPTDAGKSADDKGKTDGSSASAAGTRDKPPVDVRQREIMIVPSQGGGPRPLLAIKGSSIKQLVSLLDGFQLQYNINNAEQLYTLTADDHRELLHCILDPQGQVMWLEAFAYGVDKDDVLNALNHELWLKISHLEYEGSDPEVVRKLLLGPTPAPYMHDAYTRLHSSFYAEVGKACYCLPSTNGKRIYLNLWGIK